jgi:hypothetical protein
MSQIDDQKNQVDRAMQKTRDDLKAEAKRGVALLKELRDEIRTKLLLANAEAKREWSLIEADLNRIEMAAQNATEESKRALADALAKARAFSKRL